VKKIILLFCLFSIGQINAQDLITLKDGWKIFCKITRIDSAKIYYLPHQKDNSNVEELSISKIYVQQYTAVMNSADPPPVRTIKKDSETAAPPPPLVKSDPVVLTPTEATPVSPAKNIKPDSVTRSIFIPTDVLAGKSTVEDPFAIKRFAFGFGGGLDYGGFGVNLTFYPQKNIGLFAGGGYALAGLGYNVGLKGRITSSDFNPFLLLMYGYNTAIVVKNAESLNRLFYGPTAGIGFDAQRGSHSTGCWSFALLIPIRDSEVDDYMTALKKRGVVFKRELLPFLVSIGFKVLF
jgi:hypothetical protein